LNPCFQAGCRTCFKSRGRDCGRCRKNPCRCREKKRDCGKCRRYPCACGPICGPNPCGPICLPSPVGPVCLPNPCAPVCLPNPCAPVCLPNPCAPVCLPNPCAPCGPCVPYTGIAQPININPLAPFEASVCYIPPGSSLQCAIPLGTPCSGSIANLPVQGVACNTYFTVNLNVTINPNNVPLVVGAVITITYTITNISFTAFASNLTIYDSLLNSIGLGSQILTPNVPITYNASYTITSANTLLPSILNKAAVVFQVECCNVRSNIVSYTIYNGNSNLSLTTLPTLGSLQATVSNNAPATTAATNVTLTFASTSGNITSIVYNANTYALGSAIIIDPSLNVGTSVGPLTFTFTKTNPTLASLVTITVGSNTYNSNQITTYTVSV
jgi:hypothetical protein